MIMRALLWKELRNYRTLLLLSAVFMSIPYVIVVCFVNTMESDGVRAMPTQNLQIASMISLAIVVVLTSFVAGNAVAGERVERCAEFMAYLPISRRTVITGKAIFCLGTCLLMGAIPVVIYVLLELRSHREQFYELEWFYALITMAVFLFGVSWLLSTMLRSPTNAAACGVFSAAAISILFGLVAERTQIDSTALERVYWVMTPTIGIACFVVGIAYYLRRVEP